MVTPKSASARLSRFWRSANADFGSAVASHDYDCLHASPEELVYTEVLKIAAVGDFEEASLLGHPIEHPGKTALKWLGAGACGRLPYLVGFGIQIPSRMLSKAIKIAKSMFRCGPTPELAASGFTAAPDAAIAVGNESSLNVLLVAVACHPTAPAATIAGREYKAVSAPDPPAIDPFRAYTVLVDPRENQVRADQVIRRLRAGGFHISRNRPASAARGVLTLSGLHPRRCPA